MNFEQVRQANGQNVTMFGTFNEIGGVSLNQNQKPVCKCQIIDDSGEKHLVRLYNQNMPTPALLNMRQQFTLSSYQGQTQQGKPYTGYSGFWDDRAMVNSAPQNVPQTPHNRPQSTNVPPQAPRLPQGLKMPDTYAYPVTPETADRMARAVCIEAMLQNGQKPVYAYVTELVEYIRTGKEPYVAAEETEEKWETCSDCGQALNHCQCEPKF